MLRVCVNLTLQLFKNGYTFIEVLVLSNYKHFLNMIFKDIREENIVLSAFFLKESLVIFQKNGLGTRI